MDAVWKMLITKRAPLNVARSKSRLDGLSSQFRQKKQIAIRWEAGGKVNTRGSSCEVPSSARNTEVSLQKMQRPVKCSLCSASDRDRSMSVLSSCFIFFSFEREVVLPSFRKSCALNSPPRMSLAWGLACGLHLKNE